MSNEDFMRHMLNNRSFETLAVARLEQSLIRAIYKAFGAEARFNWELKECNKSKVTMTLSWFESMFSSFPATLRVSKVDHVYDVSWTALFGTAFFKQAWARDYLEFVDEMVVKLETEWFAMVFRVPHAEKANLMVMHNGHVDMPASSEEWTCISHVKDNVRFIVEPLTGFLQRTGDNWFHGAFADPET
jgi:hypothetical protein